MDKNLIYKKFLRFLKEKGVFDEYCSNRNFDEDFVNTEQFKESYGGWKHYDEEELKDMPYEFILKGFIWRETKQGHEYWQDINFIWKNYLKNKLDEEGRYSEIKRLDELFSSSLSSVKCPF